MITLEEKFYMKQQNNHFSAFLLIALMALFLGSTSNLMAEEPTEERTEQTAGEYLDDTVITTRVKAAIFDEPTLNSSDIHVETFKGTVQLSGFVNTQAETDKADEVARSVKNVKSVKNNIQVKGQ
jgi:osmotically-inducible protein OsmY